MKLKFQMSRQGVRNSYSQPTVLAAWMTGPSAIGSENGTPSSITSAPPACMASMIGTVAPLVGNPAVTNVTKAALPYVDERFRSAEPIFHGEYQAARNLPTSAFRFSNTALIPSAMDEVKRDASSHVRIQGKMTFRLTEKGGLKLTQSPQMTR